MGSTDARESLQGKIVIIVDDDERNIFALTSYLEQFGITIYSAKDGICALQVLEGHPEIELILMDMMMPEMDGYETIREIKSNDKTAHIPIIAVTAKAMKGDKEKCIEAGAAEYVSKPVQLNELFEKMDALINRNDR